MNKHSYIRIYNNFSFSKLIRLKSFYMFCKLPILVKNMNKIYKYASIILGTKNTNSMIKIIYGDIFFGGEKALELKQRLEEIKNENLISIADYARESLLANEEKVILYLYRKLTESLKIS